MLVIIFNIGNDSHVYAFIWFLYHDDTDTDVGAT